MDNIDSLEKLLVLYASESDLLYSNGDIIISNKNVNDEIKINHSGNEQLRTIKFTNCNFHKIFSLESFTFKANMFFESCEFDELFSLDNWNSNGMISIKECEFRKKVSLNKIFSNHITISDSEFKEDLELNSITTGGNLFLQSSNIWNTLTLRDIGDQTIPTIKSSKEKSFIICILLDSVQNITIGNLNNKIEIRTLRLNAKKKSNCKVNVINVNINELSLKEIDNNSTINLTSVNSVNIENNLLEIDDSNLNLSSFKDCDFSKFNLDFQNSKIENLNLSGTNFPEPSRINKGKPHLKQHTFDALQLIKKKLESKGDILNSNKYFETELLLKLETSKINDFKEKKDIFSQLKKMYEQRGDSVKALEYQAKELEIHMKSPDISWSERLNLKFAYWSNNFGTDWIKAVKFLVTGAAYFYFLTILAQDCVFEKNWNSFWNLISGYFEFLNPIRKLNTLTINGNEEILNNKARIADFFARIFIAFAEYQLIQAFRKYGKK